MAYGTFSTEDWASIKSAPMMAANMVMMADPSGPLGMMSEVLAAGKVAAAKDSSYAGNALVAGVVADWETLAAEAKESKTSAMEFAQQQMPDMPKFNSPEEMKAWVANALAEAVAAVNAQSPDEAAGFKQWVWDSALATANASKEGGFLGIGATLVSAPEQAALDQIKAILGL